MEIIWFVKPKIIIVWLLIGNVGLPIPGLQCLVECWSEAKWEVPEILACKDKGVATNYSTATFPFHLS